MLSQNNNALGIIFPNSYDTTVPELVTERAMAKAITVGLDGLYSLSERILENSLRSIFAFL